MVIRYKIITSKGESEEVRGDVVEKILAPTIIDGERYIVHKFIVRRYGSGNKDYSGDVDFVLPEQDIITIITH